MTNKQLNSPNILNRKARHDYFIDEEIEAGIVLKGTEVKALRRGKANLVDSHAGEKNGEIWLFNAYIAPYDEASKFNHSSRMPRKLLLHKKQINKLLGMVQRQGVTLIALAIYFNKKGLAKVKLGVARGKKKYDKRQDSKERDWKRQKDRLMKNS